MGVVAAQIFKRFKKMTDGQTPRTVQNAMSAISNDP
jgi:hypothetical protein